MLSQTVPRRSDHPRRIAALNFAAGAPYFGGLLLLALVAFWPTYLSRPLTVDAYTHLHALGATLWMVMLIAQPLAIRTRRLALHRRLGRSSYALAPLLLVSIVVLAHSKTHGLSVAQNIGIYVPLSLAALFAVSYALAILTRKVVALHARFMVCTALTLIDPVLVRIMFWIDPTPTWMYQWFTFGVTDLVFVVLMWRERDARRGRAVFPAMLATFVLAQVGLLFGFSETPQWKAFVSWFTALPLT
jgi:hypothetical protein